MMGKRTITEKKITLTFDDGPDNTYDEQILDILNRYNLKATFFMVGINVLQYPEVARAIKNEGHTVGCHSYNHPDMSTMTKEVAFKEQIERNHVVFDSVLAIKPVFFRPPFDGITNDQIRYFFEKGIITVFWTVDPGDWDLDNSTPYSIKKNVMDSVYEKEIVLLHSGRINTIKALPQIIESLQKRDFHFCTIPELLNRPGLS